MRKIITQWARLRGLIHLELVVALVLLVINLVSGRRLRKAVAGLSRIQQ